MSHPKAEAILPMDRPLFAYTDEELLELAALLEPLTRMKGWATFSKVLRDAVILSQEHGFDDLPNVTRWAGRADGLKQAWEIPTMIIAAAKKAARDADTRAEKDAPGPKGASRRGYGDDQLTS